MLFSAAPPPQPKLPYGICIDVTLCQQPPYHSICSQGLPICPSPVKTASTLASTPVIPHPTTINTSPSGVTPTAAITNTAGITPTTAIVKSTHVSTAGKNVNVLTIQNNFKIAFGGKKSNIKKPGKP